MSISKDVINWLNTTDIPISKISKKTGISRQTLYKWISYKSSDIEFVIQNSKIQKVYNMYSEHIIEKEDEMRYLVHAQKETIDLQKEKIEQLKKKVEHHQSTPVQQSIWTNLDYDYECEVKLTFENFTMGRTILSITNKEIQSKVLGYSVSEIEKLWDIGTLYKKSNQHPIDSILHKSTIKNIAKQIKSLPTLFESLKNMMGNHYIPQPLTYVCKDKSFVNAIVYNKVNWKEKTVSSKIKFLLND